MCHRLHRILPILACAGVLSWPAASAEMPVRKAGLWEMKMTMEGRGMPAMTMQQCTNAATDKLMTSNFGNIGREDCSKRDIQVSGRTVTVDSVCKIGGTTMATHAVVSGDFNAAYTIKVSSKREGGPPAPAGAAGETNLSIEAKWVGPCKDDQKPGDMILPGGQKVNITDLQNLRFPPGGNAPGPGAPRPGTPQPN